VSLVFLYGVEGVVGVLAEHHIFFIELLGVVEPSIRGLSRLEALMMMTLMGTRG
jgi:hypothetical protein